MDHIEYTRQAFMKILALDEQKLSKLDTALGKERVDGVVPSYKAQDLSLYRSHLNAYPKRFKNRRQLFLNFKGGTGKTSISISYAYRLAEMGYRVLLVDLDSQGHAAKCLGFDTEEYDKTIYEVLVKKHPIQDTLVTSPLQELKLVVSNLRMSTIDLALMPMHAREFQLQRAFEPVLKDFDFIVLDAPPSFGLLNLNALMAADDLFVPVLPDFLSFHGLKLLFDTIASLEQDLSLSLDQILILINQYNPTTRISREARTALEEHYPDFLLSTVIRQCTKFAQASSEGQPISAFDPSSKAAEDIEALLKEVFVRVQQIGVHKETLV